MSDKKVDRRVKRTRQLILEALLSLLKEKSFEAVTIQDIAERAGVNRTTFYLHYQDKYDLLTQSTKETMDELVAQTTLKATRLEQLRVEEVPPELVRWFELMATQARFYRTMLGQRGSTAFTQELRQHMEKLISQWIENLAPSNGAIKFQLDIASRYTASAHLGVIEWWLTTNPGLSANQIAAWVWQVTVLGLPTFLTAQSALPII